MEKTKQTRGRVTEEIVLSMLNDIRDSINGNYFDTNVLIDKYKGTVNSFLSLLRKQEIIIKVGKEIVWAEKRPDMAMAKKIFNEYYKLNQQSHQKHKENKERIAELKKHQESIRIAEEEQIRQDFNDVKVPLNFEVSTNTFEDYNTSKVIPIEDYQKLQINNFIHQTSQLQIEIESLKSKIINKEEKKSIRLFGIKIGSIG